jgi:RNA polymerase sigma factor (sigma-70 family)
VLLRTQPDARLAELAGEGSERAFEELTRRHRPALLRFATTMSPAGRADDVVQDSMVKAYLALGRGDRPETPKAWLFTIVRNTALNELRGWRSHEQIDENYDGVEQPPEAAERRRHLGALVGALQELPEAQRQAIVQRELEGRGHEEIAATMEISTGAVRQLIFRARTALRAGMGALIPMSLLRLAALSGAAEPAAGGIVGAGIGLTAAKVGAGALLATGAVVVGGGVSGQLDTKPAPGPSEATAQSASAAPQAGSEGARGVSGGSGRGAPAALRRGKPSKRTGVAVGAQHSPPPPRQYRQPANRPPGSQQQGGGSQQSGGQQGGQQGGGGGSGGHQGGSTGTAPAGSTQTGQQPPPTGGGLDLQVALPN